MFKKIKRWLQLWDGVWTIPLSAMLLLFVSSLLIKLWGPDVGIFPPGLINAVFIATFTFFTAFTLVALLINLYHRKWFKYYYESNEQVKEDFKNLPAWLRLMFLPLLQFFLLLLFLWLVAQMI